jgi:hypothetical protein
MALVTNAGVTGGSWSTRAARTERCAESTWNGWDISGARESRGAHRSGPGRGLGTPSSTLVRTSHPL